MERDGMTIELISILRKMNTYLPENIFLSYRGTEIIEISLDVECSIELKNGKIIKACDVDERQINILKDNYFCISPDR
jgi:hypothetical protein